MSVRTDPIKCIARHLDTAGDGSGTKLATGNYSGAATDFYFTAKRACVLYRMLMSLEDTKGMEPEEYGNLGAALTNGYDIWVKKVDGTKILDFTDGVPIKQNHDFGRVMFDVEVSNWTNTTNEAAHVQLSFVKACNGLYLPKGYSFGVTLNDNFSGLIDHYFMIQGEYL